MAKHYGNKPMKMGYKITSDMKRTKASHGMETLASKGRITGSELACPIDFEVKVTGPKKMIDEMEKKGLSD